MAEQPLEHTFPGDWADADRAYHNYVENCRRAGLQPMSWDEARVLMAEWSAKLEACGSTTRNPQ